MNEEENGISLELKTGKVFVQYGLYKVLTIAGSVTHKKTGERAPALFLSNSKKVTKDKIKITQEMVDKSQITIVFRNGADGIDYLIGKLNELKESFKEVEDEKIN